MAREGAPRQADVGHEGMRAATNAKDAPAPQNELRRPGFGYTIEPPAYIYSFADMGSRRARLGHFVQRL